MKKPIFTGVCTALVTPFDKNGKTDFEAFKNLINFQIKGGVSALLFLGTTGEASTMSLDEKKEIVQFAKEQVNGRLPIIVGIGGNNPSTIIEFAKTLSGIDGVLLSSPYYNKATQAGLVTFFHTIANNIRLPIIVYNVPSRTGQNIEPETFAQICKNRYIAGIKEASGNITQFAEVIRNCPNTPVYSGDDAFALPSYALGAKGVISVASNAVPTQTQTIFDLLSKQENKEAKNLFYTQLPLYRALFCEVNPIPVKYLLADLGIIKNHLRLPLTPLSQKWYNQVCHSYHSAAST